MERPSGVYLDDGTGVILLDLTPYMDGQAKRNVSHWRLERGMYILVLAVLDLIGDDLEVGLTVFVIKDLTSEPDRWSMWLCELVEHGLATFEVSEALGGETQENKHLDLVASPVAA